MTQIEAEDLLRCYRTIREIAGSHSKEPRVIQSLNLACGALLVARGKQDTTAQKIAPVASSIFGSQGGFVFVPFL